MNFSSTKILISRTAIAKKIAGITHTGACELATAINFPVWFADWFVIEYIPTVGVFACILAATAINDTAIVTITANRKKGLLAITTSQ